MSSSEQTIPFKSGLVTLLGRSNVGKSTLMNTLVGTKLAAVTHKPQTTRQNIHGVLNVANAQIVFVDTPGLLRLSGDPLSGKLANRITEALTDIDLVIYVADPTKSIGAEERRALAMLRHLAVPKLLVINKADLPNREKIFLQDYQDLAGEFDSVFELSALYRRHVQPLIDKIVELLPQGEPLYPPDQLTNVDKFFWVAELIREKIFLALREEVPYTTHVEVTEIEEKPDIFVISAIVYTYDSRYKKMIIGSRGRALKEIGQAARKELEAALNKKVYLELEVETDKHWIERV